MLVELVSVAETGAAGGVVGVFVGTELEGGKEVYRLERHLQKAIFGDVYEVRGLTSGRHLAVKDTFGDDDRHYVITDLASGGDLMEALQIHSDGFQEDQAKLLILDAARGLASLHMRGLAMQDVTLENMLLFVEPDGQWQVRVCDPGQVGSPRAGTSLFLSKRR
eukprot:s296_g13.t1